MAKIFSLNLGIPIKVRKENDGSGIIFSLSKASARYYVINKIGYEILENLYKKKNIRKIANSLGRKYDINKNVIINDISQFLNSLIDVNLAKKKYVIILLTKK